MPKSSLLAAIGSAPKRPLRRKPAPRKPKPAPVAKDPYANDPLLKALLADRQEDEASAGRQSVAAQAAMLKAYEAAQPQLRDIYNRSIASQTKTEEALGRQLRGEGRSAGEGLTAALSAIGAGPQQAQALDKTYRGAETAGLAMGLSDVGRLRARGAAAEEFLAKGPGLATSQAQANLARRMSEIGSQYKQDKRGALVSAVQRRDAQLARLEQNKMAREESIAKQRLALQALGNKNDLAMFDAKTRQEDIALRAQYAQQLAMINNEARLVNTELSASLKPKPKPGAKAKKPETVATPGSAKRRGAVNAVNAVIFNPKTGQPRQAQTQAGGATAGSVVRAINSALLAQGIKPNSPVGIQIRSATLRRMGIKPGPKGNPAGGI